MADSVVAQLVAKERPYRLRNRHLYITMSGSLKRDFIVPRLASAYCILQRKEQCAWQSSHQGDKQIPHLNNEHYESQRIRQESPHPWPAAWFLPPGNWVMAFCL
jgi:hypothetical protein